MTNQEKHGRYLPASIAGEFSGVRYLISKLR